LIIWVKLGDIGIKYASRNE